jgi:hypothetical protein
MDVCQYHTSLLPPPPPSTAAVQSVINYVTSWQHERQLFLSVVHINLRLIHSILRGKKVQAASNCRQLHLSNIISNLCHPVYSRR